MTAENTRFVLDCSVTMSWCFEDEIDPFSEHALDLLANGSTAVVPGIWSLEVVNVLLVAERRKRLRAAQSRHFLELLDALPIVVETRLEGRRLELFSLAREATLSAYDTSYLMLAILEGLPLATRDLELQRSARRVGVELLRTPG